MTEPNGAEPAPQVRDAMLTVPATHSPDTTVEQARAALANPKLHMLLLTRDGRLLGTVVVDDLEGADPAAPALSVARLEGRTVSADASLTDLHAAMAAGRIRRLAVVDDDARLLGLLCLKGRLDGFCSDDGVAERRRARGRPRTHT